MKEVVINVKIEDAGVVENLNKLQDELAALNKERDNLLKSNLSTEALSKALNSIDSEINQLNSTYQKVTQSTNSYKQAQQKAAEEQLKAVEATKRAAEQQAKLERTIKVSEGITKTFAGSINVVTASLSTFGIENEDVAKSLLKVQAAASLATGIKDLTEGYRALSSSLNIAKAAQIAFNGTLLANPYVLAAAAIVALVAGVVAYTSAVSSNSDAVKKAKIEQEQYNAIAESAIQSYTKEKIALDDLFVSLGDVTLNTQQRGLIIDEINTKYGEYLPNLLTEKSTNEEIASAYDLVNEALIRKALTQAKIQALEKATADLLETQVAANKRIAQDQAIIDEQKRKGYGKVSVEARESIKRQKETLKQSQETYKQTLDAIEKSTLDLEKALLTATAKTQKKQVTNRTNVNNQIRKNNQNANKTALTDAEKAENDALKLIEDRYNKEVDIINDFKLEQENLLKEDLANRKITQEQFNDGILALNVGINNKLLKQNENFIVTDEEKKKIGNANLLILEEKLSDDKLKINGAYFDALNAVNLSQVEKQKFIDEQEKKRLAEIKAEEERILKERLDNFNNEYILKKTALLQNVNLKEKELDVELQKAQIENLQNQLSVYALGSDEYFKLIEQIVAAQRKLNQTLIKNTEDAQKEALANIKQLVGDISNIVQDVSKNFESVGQTGLQTLEDITNKVPDLIAKFQDETLSQTEKIAAGFAFVGASIGEINSIIQDASEERIDAINSEEQARIAALQRQKDAGLITEQQLASGTQRIQEEYAKKRRAAEKKAFVQEKGVRIAQAVAQTASAVLNAYSSGVATPIIGPATGAIYAGIAAAFGAAQIALIASQKFPESGGGGGASSTPTPSIPSSGAQQPTSFAPATFGSGISQQQTFGAQQGTGGGVLRAYVSETDLVDTQRRLRNIRRAGEL